MDDLVDISVPLRARMPTYPGDVPYQLTTVTSFEEGHAACLSKVVTGTHAGTHLDAPGHFVPGGARIEDVSLEACIGPAWVASFSDHVTAESLELAGIPYWVERLLMRTPNSELWAAEPEGFVEDYVSVLPSAAEWMLARGLRLVGIDYLSIERFGYAPTTHRLLLGADILILEGLNLTAVTAGPYELFCFPLLLEGAEAAPVRAVLRRES